MREPPVIDVNEFGRDEQGNEFGWAATPAAVADGLMVNRPVTLRFPDGVLIRTTQALITKKGMERLQREFPVAEREAQGGVQ